VCETLKWACQATDPKECPPLPALPVKLVRFSIVEGDGKTVGTATSLLEDGLKQIMTTSSPLASSLRECVTADGRYQCMSIMCMKMQNKGAPPFAGVRLAGSSDIALQRVRKRRGAKAISESARNIKRCWMRGRKRRGERRRRD